MSKLRRGYGVKTEQVAVAGASVRMSVEMRFFIGCLCLCAGAIFFVLAMDEWWWNEEKISGVVLTGLWGLAGVYMFVTFAFFSHQPQSYLASNTVKKEMSTTFARPVTAEGEEIIRRTRNLMPNRLEVITQRTTENYKAIILLLFGFYISYILYGFIIDEDPEIFAYIFPLVCIGMIGSAVLLFPPGPKIALQALLSLLYLILILPIGFVVIFIYGVTGDVWLALGIIVASIVMVSAMIQIRRMRMRKPRRRYTFPRSLKEKKEDDA